MTQVRVEYLRWITVYLWNCGIPACDHEQKEFRLLAYTSLGDLRSSLLPRLQELTTERFQELRNYALLWVERQDSEKLTKWFADFDLEQRIASSRAKQPKPEHYSSRIDATV